MPLFPTLYYPLYNQREQQMPIKKSLDSTTGHYALGV